MNKNALIAMSGGVDSSVAAFLCQQDGYNCTGATMRLYDKTGSSDVSDAEKVCERLGIKFYVFDVRDEFERCVIDQFVSDYENCRTPNPCIVCNKTMKFGKFMKN